MTIENMKNTRNKQHPTNRNDNNIKKLFTFVLIIIITNSFVYNYYESHKEKQKSKDITQQIIELHQKVVTKVIDFIDSIRGANEK